MSPSRLPDDAPEPAGFGRCGECAYRATGTADLCFTCASRELEAVDEDRCMICDGRLYESKRCGNPLCNRSADERGWEVVWAISMRSGALKRAISAYKYDGKYGWGWIFARVLVGYLDANDGVFNDYDLIIPVPTYVGEGGRDWDHIGYIIENAEKEGPRWPFRHNIMSKTKATPKLVEQQGFAARAWIAEYEIRPALRVLDRAAVDGKRVLVFDDVFTGGLTLRETAFKLRDAGATSVDGIVLARQPFRS